RNLHLLQGTRLPLRILRLRPDIPLLLRILRLRPDIPLPLQTPRLHRRILLQEVHHRRNILPPQNHHYLCGGIQQPSPCSREVLLFSSPKSSFPVSLVFLLPAGSRLRSRRSSAGYPAAGSALLFS